MAHLVLLWSGAGIMTALIVGALLRGDRFPRATAVLPVAASLTACLAWEAFRYERVTRPRVELARHIMARTPELSRPGLYASSDTCRACHPGEYATWHRTYHRTMTQLALPGSVLGEFDGSQVESAGVNYLVFRRGDEFWARMPDPDVVLDITRSKGRAPIDLEDVPIVERQVLMTTGSHHYQTYWVASERFQTVMNTLPLVFLPRQKQWIPREAAFMTPPDEPLRMITIWNDHCLNCHSTGGNPGLRGPRELHTSVGELGIACEACHGRAEAHVSKHRGLSARFRARLDAAADDSIVNPARLDHRRSSQVCGQCHGVFIRNESQGMTFARQGDQYRPGDDLHEYRFYIEFPTAKSPNDDWERFRANRPFYADRWWDDGTMLAAGREYTALRATACFQQGELSCLSCHSMHDADPDDQLIEFDGPNAACVQCHDESKFASRLADHTHHVADSGGSECMNCHMPRTSYALFNATRNHAIGIPAIGNSVEHGVPNACNLCHLDKTLAWTEDRLWDWYGQPRRELAPEHRSTSAAVLWLLKGHAAQRVITAWHVGWAPARQASGDWWSAPLVAQLLADPYGVVRRVAENALRNVGYGDDDYNFLATPDALRSAVDHVVARWAASSTDRVGGGAAEYPRPSPRAVLQRSDGELDVGRMHELLDARDNRPVRIKE
jgi:predicted CXXCH cytochrome family protein